MQILCRAATGAPPGPSIGALLCAGAFPGARSRRLTDLARRLAGVIAHNWDPSRPGCETALAI
eukprot:1515831-Lingulodinium_polyedra.AAC.1